MLRRLLLGALVLLTLLGVIWASDQITLQGERTIYTVTCKQGRWLANRCTGDLAPGERRAFRASRTRQEVIQWIRGSEEPSQKYTDCQVKNRDNWKCHARENQKPLVVDELIIGRPAWSAAESTAIVPFHAVAKWKWYALQAGIRVFTDADY
jgi:hypothetical protein